MPTISLPVARRIALAAQGFDEARPSGRIDVRHFRRVMSATSLIQIDSVNVVSRAHYLPFFSRLGPYPRDALDAWLWQSGEVFEYWAHEASLIPIDQRPLLRHRMIEGKSWWRVEDLQADHPGYLEAVLTEVRENGPLTVSELEDPGERTGPWWGYGKGKIALEHLFAAGAVTVADRPRFTRRYAVPERIHPPEVLGLADVPREEAILELLALGAKAHGIGTVTDFADYYRLPIKDARRLLPQLVERGVINPVDVPGWTKEAFVHHAARRPNKVTGRALLAPFDPLVWHRERVERLFGFSYRIEIYVPQPKRKFGYYVLPFLLDERLVGRVDLKADREERRLLVRASHHEADVDVEQTAFELAGELQLMARWLDLDGVVVHRSGNLAPALSVEIAGGGSS